MPPKPKEYIQLRFPEGGLDLSMPLQYAPPYTTPNCSNFVPFDTLTDKARGGSRPGIDAYGSLAASPVRMMSEVRWSNSGVFTSTTLASANGLVYKDSGTGTWTSVGSGAPTVPFCGASYLQDFYYPINGGGLNAIQFGGSATTGAQIGDTGLIDPAGDGSQTYVTTGNVPPDPPTNCTIWIRWQDRLVAAGDTTNPNNVFMSAQGNARDWRYGLIDSTASAVALASSSSAGSIGDIVTALMAHTDQCLIIGCRSSMMILRGNPNTGGTLSPLVDGVGCLTCHSWCYDDQGYLYWMSQDGLYMMSPGCDGQVIRAISRPRLPRQLVGLREDQYFVSMAYDRRFRGIHLVVEPISSGTAQNYFISVKNSFGNVGEASFWLLDYDTYHPTMVFCRPYYRPTSGSIGPVVFGGKTGTMKIWDETVPCEVASMVDYGPFPLAPAGYTGLLKEIQVASAVNSNSFTVAPRVGQTAEAAYNASALDTYTMSSGGLEYTQRPRAAGSFCCIRVAGDAGSRIAVEDIIIQRETVRPRRKGS